MICDKQCETCKPIPKEQYEEMKEEEKDNEIQKISCRLQRSLTRYWRREC